MANLNLKLFSTTHLLLFIIFFFFFFFLLTAATTLSSTTSTTATTGAKSSSTTSAHFIRSACTATHYQTLCFDCLYPFADKINNNERQLSLLALTISSRRAKSTFRSLNPHDNSPSMAQCRRTLGIAARQLAAAVNEMNAATGSRGDVFLRHMANIQTWVGAALDNQETCLEGLDRDNNNNNNSVSTRKDIAGVNQVTSNALALVASYTAAHGSSGNGRKKPTN